MCFNIGYVAETDSVHAKPLTHNNWRCCDTDPVQSFVVFLRKKIGRGPLFYILCCLLKVNFKRQFKGRIAFLPLKIPIARRDNVHDIFTEICGRYRDTSHEKPGDALGVIVGDKNLGFDLFAYRVVPSDEWSAY